MSSARTHIANPAEGVDRDFYVRQLRDWKFSVPIEAMLPAGMTAYARLPRRAPASGQTMPPSQSES